MTQVTEPEVAVWTATDLAARFGAIPLNRIRHNPPPGLATEDDVVEIHDREGRLYELVDGVLVEKTVGAYESYLALLIGSLLRYHAEAKNLGFVLGADGMMRLAPDLVRIPDVSFISWNRVPTRRVPRDPIANLAPDLAVEVISKGNTREEMQGKLHEYFDAGVRLVWYVYHAPRPEVHVYADPSQFTVLTLHDTLDGGDLLPGFRLEVARLFAEPGQAPSA